MPNWVFNTVAVSGDIVEMERLREQLNAPFETHFPKSEYNKDTKTWDTIPDVQVYSNPVFSFWNVIKPTNLDAYYGKETHKVSLENFGEDYNNALSKDESWYWWNNRNWGTKWDIAVQDGQEYADTNFHDEGDAYIYQFRTAWAPVHQILDILSEQYPTLRFSYGYEEEQGWGGEAEWANGKMQSEYQYDIPESHADHLERDRECVCEWLDEPDAWYADCPRQKVGA